MGKKTKSNKSRKKDVDAQPLDHAGISISSGDMIWVDPARIRFQHSRIRPVFSGCGRSVVGTLEEIRHGRLSPSDLPPILVIVGRPETNEFTATMVGDDDEDDVSGRRSGRRRKQQPRNASLAGSQTWYFSLNNRRLWVLKRCREEGLLVTTENKVLVRVREPKSQQELERYCVENCALEAKIMHDPSGGRDKNQKRDGTESNDRQDENTTKTTVVEMAEEERKTKLPISEDTASEGDEHDIDDSQSDDEDDDEDDYRAPSNRFGALLI